METLSLAAARRVALAAQGLDRSRRALTGPVTMRHLQSVVDRVGLIQIDSVNVLARAHLMPLFTRLGPYDPGLLDRAAAKPPRRLVETWAHVASYIPPTTWPLLAWRRQKVRAEAWGSISRVATTHPGLIGEVQSLVAARGPVTARDVHAQLGATHPRTRDEWGWNWTVAKQALEYLFFTGELASAGRNSQFERCYDLAERVLPAHVLNRPPVPEADAVRELIAIGARAHGIGSTACFQDYFRLRGPLVTQAVRDLTDDGQLRPVRVDGWAKPTYLHACARMPRRVTAAALVSPFDPVLFERARVESLFGMRFRIEIYVPAGRRIDGYYVLPFLENGAFTAKVDLKADRAAGVLRVQAAHRLPEAGPQTAERLAGELGTLAAWLGLTDIAVAPVGDFAADLSYVVGHR